MSIYDKYLDEHPEISAADVINRLEAPPLNVVSTDDLSPEIDLLYDRGRDKGQSTGWPSLDYFYRVALGYWTLVTGFPNMGKSAWVDNLAINTMTRHSWRWLFFSAENRPYEAHWAGLAELFIGKPFDKEHPYRMSAAEREEAKGFLRNHCWHVLIDDKQPMTVKRILDVAKASVEKYAINCLVIDPWNELEHSRPNGMSETEYVSNALTQVRSFARSLGVHVFVVAHPAKRQAPKNESLLASPPTPHDVSGSAHFWNKSDYAICIHRDYADKTGETFVHVQKARHRWVARLGSVSIFHDWRTNRYLDISERERRPSREPGDDDE